MIFVLPLLFSALLLFGLRDRIGRERKLYIALGILALALSFFASRAADGDHIGASLSGMISVFMR